MLRIYHWKIGVVLLLFALPSGRAAAQDIYVGENIVFGPQEVTVEQCQQGPVLLPLSLAKPAGSYLLQIKADPSRKDIMAKVALNDRYAQKYVPTYIEHLDGTAFRVVSLQAENALSVLVKGDPGASIAIALFEHGRILSPYHREDGLAFEIFPDIEAGITQEIKFGTRTALDNTSYHITSVHIEEVDAAGNLITSLGELLDDGNGIFGAKKTITAGNDTMIRYFAFLVNRGDATEIRRIVPVSVFKSLTPAEREAETAAGKRAVEEFLRLEESVGQEEAIRQVIPRIADEPRVIAVGHEPGSQTVWIEYASGKLGGFRFGRPGIRSGRNVRGGLRQTNQNDSSLFPESATP